MQLSARLGEGLRLDYDHDPLLDPIGREPAARLPDGVSGVHGHFRPHRYQEEARFAFVTMLRHPVDNIISIYFFWKSFPSVGNPVHDAFLAEQPDIATFASHEQMRILMSEVYFGGFDMGRFDFIGFHETRSDDLARLGRLLGIELSAEVHHNRTGSEEAGVRRAIEESAHLRAKLEGALKDDIRFYESLHRRRGPDAIFR